MLHGHINRFVPKSKIDPIPDESVDPVDKSMEKSNTLSFQKNDNVSQEEGDRDLPDEEENAASLIVGSTSEEIPVVVEAQNISVVNDRAGEVETLTFGSLEQDRIFLVDLSEKQFTSYAFRWERGSLFYGLSPDTSLPQFTEVQEDDEREGSEEIKVSYLYVSENSAGKKMILYPQTQVTGLEISLIRPYDSVAETRGGFNAQLNYDSGASYSSLPIVSRDEWGAELSNIDDPANLSWDPYYYHANRIIIHHTVTPNQPADPEVYMRAVYLYHKNTKGWGDVGYNYLIDHLGNIYEGKLGGEEVKGYHAGSQANRGSIGIALLGNFEEATPTKAARTALIKLMAEKGAFYKFKLKYGLRASSKWVNDSYTIFSHKDAFNLKSGVWTAEATSCSGLYLYNLLPSLSKKAQEYKQNHFSKIKSIAIEAQKEFLKNYEEDTLYVFYDLPESVNQQTVLNLIPSFSGITEKVVRKNMAMIKVADWDNGGYVPPADWDRYVTENVQTYYPESRGTEDRLKTLYKIFRLDNDVEHVGLNYIGEYN